jgi:hypothetical protein
MRHGFRLAKQDDYFQGTFDHFRKQGHFFEADGPPVKIDVSLMPNN